MITLKTPGLVARAMSKVPTEELVQTLHRWDRILARDAAGGFVKGGTVEVIETLFSRDTGEPFLVKERISMRDAAKIALAQLHSRDRERVSVHRKHGMSYALISGSITIDPS